MEKNEFDCLEGRKACINYFEEAKKNFDINLLDQTLVFLKKAILKAEEVYHHTGAEKDKYFLIDVYKYTAKFFVKKYDVINDKKDLQSAIIYYEKILYFYENEYAGGSNIDNIRGVMEAYVHILWNALNLSDIKIYERYLKRAKKTSKLLYKKSHKYDDEQFIILIIIFEGDYQKILKHYRRAYLKYYYAAYKLEKIYYNLPQIGIQNDLIDIYQKLIDLSQMLKCNRTLVKWHDKLNVIKGNKIK